MGKVLFLPDERSVSVKPGSSLLEIAKRAGIPIRTRCQGKAGCLMCKVDVQGDGIMPPTDAEKRKMGIQQSLGLRLACQAKIGSPACDLIVIVPEDPLKAAVRRQLQQQEDDNLW